MWTVQWIGFAVVVHPYGNSFVIRISKYAIGVLPPINVFVVRTNEALQPVQRGVVSICLSFLNPLPTASGTRALDLSGGQMSWKCGQNG